MSKPEGGPAKRRVGRNPLEKLNARQSSKHLQSEPHVSQRHVAPIMKKVREMQIQFDWTQFYDQAVPEGLKKLSKKLFQTPG